MTGMEAARLRSLANRTVHASDPMTLVAALDQITDLYPDPRSRPPAAAVVHDTLAARLAATTKETP